MSDPTFTTREDRFDNDTLQDPERPEDEVQDDELDDDPRASAVTEASSGTDDETDDETDGDTDDRTELDDDVDRDALSGQQPQAVPAFGGTPVTGTPATPVGGNAADQRFFQDSVTEKLRDRWQAIQIDFVDDPRQAVEQAETLVEQVSTQLTEALEARRRELHGSWSKDGSTASAAHDDAVPTEDLRTALQEYRQVFNQLLAL